LLFTICLSVLYNAWIYYNIDASQPPIATHMSLQTN
jgi:hypothetical protein